jgi:hypothetical protein
VDHVSTEAFRFSYEDRDVSAHPHEIARDRRVINSTTQFQGFSFFRESYFY